MNKKTGTVRVVARSGGIKFVGEDVWYNPSESVKPLVTAEFKGKVVELDMVSPTLFTGIRLAPVGVAVADREVVIVRQSCVKAAAEFAKARPELVRSPEMLLGVAALLERWVVREQ